MNPSPKPVKPDNDYAVVLFALALVICVVALLALIAGAIFLGGISLFKEHPTPVACPTPVITMVPVPGLTSSTTEAGSTGNNPGETYAEPGNADKLSRDIAYVSDHATRTIYTLDTETGALVPAFRVDFDPGKCILSKDARKAYIASDNSLMILDMKSGDVINKLDFEKSIALMDVTSDGSKLIVYTAANDEGDFVDYIDTSTDRILLTIGNVPYSWGMSISDDGILYLGDYFKCQLLVITLLENPSGYRRQTIKCASPASYTLLTYWKNNTYWDNAGCVGAVALSPDGSHIYVSRWSSLQIFHHQRRYL